MVVTKLGQVFSVEQASAERNEAPFAQSAACFTVNLEAWAFTNPRACRCARPALTSFSALTTQTSAPEDGHLTLMESHRTIGPVFEERPPVALANELLEMLQGEGANRIS